MDQEALVTGAREDGRRLVDWLAANGMPVTAAGWLERETDSQPYLYIVTTEAGLAGTLAGYRKLSSAFDTLQPCWVRPNEVRLISAEQPLAVGLRQRADLRPPLDTWLGPSARGVQIGGVPVVGEAFVYANRPVPTPA